MDNDLGYGILRVDEAQEWEPRHLAQPLLNLVNACIFEYGIAMYDLDLGESLRSGDGFTPEQKEEMRTTGRRAARSAFRDYVLHPLLSAPTGSARTTLTANLVANLARNVWSHSVIMCGHFPEGVETFEVPELDEARDAGAVVPPPDARLRRHLGPTAAPRAVRQPLAPDRAPPLPGPPEQPLPRDRRPSARALRAPRTGHNTAPLWRQVASAWHRVVRLSVPSRH